MSSKTKKKNYIQYHIMCKHIKSSNWHNGIILIAKKKKQNRQRNKKRAIVHAKCVLPSFKFSSRTREKKWPKVYGIDVDIQSSSYYNGNKTKKKNNKGLSIN